MRIDKNFVSVLQLALLVIITGLLVWSAPWSDSNIKEARTITVTGDTTIEATPEEFRFSFYFEKKGDDEETLKTELTEMANQSVSALKDLGVDESDIKLDASSYDNWYFESGEDGVLRVNLTVTVSDNELSQEVQDYILSTDAKGQLSPQAVFSEDQKKRLDEQAVEEASQEALKKAEKQAELFNAKLGKVIEIQQGQDSIFNPVPFAVGLDATAESASLPVLPGQNDYRQSVTVKYELK